MKRLIGSTILAVFLLSGCQLAADSPQEGQLVGVYVTTDVVSIPGEMPLEDINVSSDGSIVLSDAPTGGKLYAEERTDEKGDPYYVFPDAEGVAFYHIPIVEEDGQICIHQEHNQAIQERHLTTSIENGVEINQVEGTIYAPTWGEQKLFYANPIYQTADGQVYLTATGDAFDCASMLTEGGYVGYTWSETITVKTQEGVKETGLSLSFGYAAKNPVEKVVFTQMTADHRPISSQEYPVDQMPENLPVDPAAAYILAESHCVNGRGMSYVDRTLLDRNDEEDQTFTTYIQEIEGIFSRQTTALLWEEVGG